MTHPHSIKKMNQRENRKKARITKLRMAIEAIKETGQEIDKEKVISMLIVEEGVSRRTAIEEVDAVINYYG